jgi:dTDP-4-amino-4,6-dideoxygalactose transaminase
MHVPMVDLPAQFRQIETEVMDAMHEVCVSQSFILGPRVKELEERVAEYSQSAHGIGVSSGTDALLAALMALEIGPGDEVITTPFTFFATGGVIARLGARPLLCDIDPVTFNLSPATLADVLAEDCERRDGRLVNRRTGGAVRVLLPVHLFGQMADMEALMELARGYGLRVVEDAAQAIGAENARRRRAGSLGDIGCFSFFPSKNLGAFGDAGLCTTNDAELAERLAVLRVHGGKPKYHHALIGGNFRLDALQAAVLLVKLRYLDGWTAARQENARAYTSVFAGTEWDGFASPPGVLDGYRHIFHQYVLRVTRRDELRKALADAGVGTEVYYPVPLHMQRCFAYLGHSPEDFPESRSAAEEVLAIPIDPALSEAQREHVIHSTGRFYGVR